jgi:predicted N-formylglutamate amidohydrolase
MRPVQAEQRSGIAHTFVVSCEHAGNAVPPEYRHLFASENARAALDSHRGWDPGSEPIGRRLAEALDAPLAVQRVSRLLVECNRSLGHPRLWSEFSVGLSDGDKAIVLERYWRAHRTAVRRLVEESAHGTLVVHVGVHTFAPVWKGRARGTDMGLLYDPRRALEREIAGRWKSGLVAAFADQGLRVHLNRPYRGWTDGLTTTLRAELPATRYVGLELEVSQRLAPLDARAAAHVAETLRAAMG